MSPPLSRNDPRFTRDEGVAGRRQAAARPAGRPRRRARTTRCVRGAPRGRAGPRGARAARRCTCGSPGRSRRGGSASAPGRAPLRCSRLAAPKTSQTYSPAAIFRPPSSVSAVATRRIACCGVSRRTTSSTNAGISSGRGTDARLQLGVAGEPEDAVSDRARRRVVSGGDEHHHDPDQQLVVERRQLRIAAHECADHVVAGVAPSLLDHRGHVRPELLAHGEALRAPGRALPADLVDAPRPVVDQPPVAVREREQKAERARRKRVAERLCEVAVSGSDERVEHLARVPPERRLERFEPVALEVGVEQPAVDGVLGRVALERRAERAEERDDVRDVP